MNIGDWFVLVTVICWALAFTLGLGLVVALVRYDLSQPDRFL
jgi:hypothetical protein